MLHQNSAKNEVAAARGESCALLSFMLSLFLASLPQPPSASVTAGKRVRVELLLLLRLVALALPLTSELRPNLDDDDGVESAKFGDGDVARMCLLMVMHVLLLVAPQYCR